METTVEWAIIERLVPNPVYIGTYGYDTFEWKDERPFPSQEALDAEKVVFDAEWDKKMAIRAAEEAYAKALTEGYYYTDGCRYYCDERATTDMTKAIMLVGIGAKEPIPIIDMSGIIHSFYIEDFQALAKAIGMHQYALRQQLWASIAELGE